MTNDSARSVVVIGGGIAGLAAAYEAHTHAGASVTVLEAAPTPGGKLATSAFAGIPLDTSADAFLARVPWGTELCREIDLGDELVSPAVASAYVWKDGALRRLPAGLVLGVPTDLDALAASGLISPAGLARAAADLERSPNDAAELAATAQEESVGSLVRRRLGDEVFEVLVDPLLSGVNAGDADQLSVSAVAPQLATAARRDTSLIRALRAQAASAGRPPGATAAADDDAGDGAVGLAPGSVDAGANAEGSQAPDPVFFTVVGGMGRIVDRLVERVGPAHIRCNQRVDELDFAEVSDNPRYRIVSGGEVIEAEFVILATPAAQTAALLRPLAPGAASLLDQVGYASVTLVSLAYRPSDVPRPLDASGFLVPRDSGLLLTACSWSSSKFAHLGADGIVRLRASVGRSTDTRADNLSDAEVLEAVRRDLTTTMGIIAAPLESRVSRWPASLPQYRLGHLNRVHDIERLIAKDLPGVGVAGAAYRGLGVPACINSGRSAVRALLPQAGLPHSGLPQGGLPQAE